MPAAGAVAAERPKVFHDAMRDDSAGAGKRACVVELDHAAIVTFEPRFVIERIDMARPALHEDEDGALGPRRMVRRPRRQRIGGRALRQAGEREIAEAASGVTESLAAGE